MRWMKVSAADPLVRVMADRHYPRQKAGSKFFSPPGSKVVLSTPERDAYWISLSQKHVDHAWPGAWCCSAFRNESRHLSSELVLEALAATRALWGDPPAAGLITFVDAAATARRRSKRALPGHCFRVLGFVEAGSTGSGKVCLHLSPAQFPAARAPLERQIGLFGP